MRDVSRKQRVVFRSEYVLSEGGDIVGFASDGANGFDIAWFEFGKEEEVVQR
jgi:hypothetical protein